MGLRHWIISALAVHAAMPVSASEFICHPGPSGATCNGPTSTDGTVANSIFFDRDIAATTTISTLDDSFIVIRSSINNQGIIQATGSDSDAIRSFSAYIPEGEVTVDGFLSVYNAGGIAGGDNAIEAENFLQIINNGIITAEGIAINNPGGIGSSIRSIGEISSGTTAIVTGNSATIENDGLIIGDEKGIVARDGTTIINRAQIQAGDTLSQAGDKIAIEIASGTITNDYSIDGGAVAIRFTASDKNSTVVNASGAYIGGSIVVAQGENGTPANTGAQTIYNRGVIGGLDLGAGDDAYYGYDGSRVGAAFFGDGNDVAYFEIDAAFPFDVLMLDGGAGTDLFSFASSRAFEFQVESLVNGVLRLVMQDMGGRLGFELTNWESFDINGTSYSYDQLVAMIPGQPSVPEPSTWAMMVIGFALIGLTLRSGPSREPHGPHRQRLSSWARVAGSSKLLRHGRAL